MHEAEIEPEWIIGTSIGAINASLIAGNALDRRLARLRELWSRVTQNSLLAAANANPFVAAFAPNAGTIAGGVPGFLSPILGDSHPSIHFMLVIGRNGDLDKDDLARLRWRSDNVSFGNYKMTCCTFDDLLYAIRRRLSFEAQPSLGG